MNEGGRGIAGGGGERTKPQNKKPEGARRRRRRKKGEKVEEKETGTADRRQLRVRGRNALIGSATGEADHTRLHRGHVGGLRQRPSSW